MRESLVGTANEDTTVVNIANSDDDVKAMDEETDPTDGWDLNKVWVYTDPDGNKVPVPIGFTASGAESEKYVNHNVEKTGTLTDLTFHSEGEYPWTQNEEDVWTSGNKGVASSISELVSNEIMVAEEGAYLTIEWCVSSEWADALSITITNSGAGTSDSQYLIRGTRYGSNYEELIYSSYSTELEEGKYTISIRYTKNESTDAGLDSGYVKSGTILNYDNLGTDTVTVHEYGGFVIYEGEGEVTDSNAWDESKNRNQFVWVPVEDTSRIYETNSTTGKKKSKLWNFTLTGRTARSNADTDTRTEPGIASIYYSTDSRQYSDVVRAFSQYGLQGQTNDLWYRELESVYKETIDSIEKYGRFLYRKVRNGKYIVCNTSS